MRAACRGILDRLSTTDGQACACEKTVGSVLACARRDMRVVFRQGLPDRVFSIRLRQQIAGVARRDATVRNRAIVNARIFMRLCS